MIRISFLSLTLAALLIEGCAINPVSGRAQPVLTTEAGEIEQGREAAKIVAEQMGLVEDPRLSAYVIAGVSPSRQFANDSPAYDAMGRSFHPLTAAERAEIREDRLRLARARSGETLEQLLQRLGSSWKPEEAAVANGIGAEAGLRGGTLIKVAVPEPYRGQ